VKAKSATKEVKNLWEALGGLPAGMGFGDLGITDKGPRRAPVAPPVRQFAKTYHTPLPIELTTNFDVLRDALKGVAESIRGFSFRGAVTGAPDQAVGGMFSALAPVLDRLTIPLRNVGHLIGSVLAPILEALTPVLNLVAKGFGYIIQANGYFIRAIGDLLYLLPGSIGKPLVKFGQNMSDAARSTRAAIDAKTDLTKGSQQLSDALLNAVQGFKIQAYGPGAQAVPRQAPPTTTAAAAPISVGVTIHTSGDGRETYRKFYERSSTSAAAGPEKPREPASSVFPRLPDAAGPSDTL